MPASACKNTRRGLARDAMGSAAQPTHSPAWKAKLFAACCEGTDHAKSAPRGMRGWSGASAGLLGGGASAQALDQARHDLRQVRRDAVARQLEDRASGVLVDRQDSPRPPNADRHGRARRGSRPPDRSSARCAARSARPAPAAAASPCPPPAGGAERPAQKVRQPAQQRQASKDPPIPMPTPTTTSAPAEVRSALGRP